METCLSLRQSPGWVEGRARFGHPIYDPVRGLLERLAQVPDWPDTAGLNALGTAIGRTPQTATGRRIRFVAPQPDAENYELRAHAHGEVATRPQDWHDLFNALAWFAFPQTKAALNAIHVSEMPRESGRRGPTRDLLTIFDEGGAVVACADPDLVDLIHAFRWHTLFWSERDRVLASMRFVVFGHAVLEQALSPWAGISCKVLFVPVSGALLAAPVEQLVGALDTAAAAWFYAHAPTASPRALAPLPVFGYPGWSDCSGRPEFYADTRFFRPKPPTGHTGDGRMVMGVGQAVAASAVSGDVEESPGSAERDAG